MKNKEKEFVIPFEEISIADVAYVGGKNAALGEMYRNLVPKGIGIPGGFAVTAAAYRHFLKKTRLDSYVKETIRGLDTRNIADLQSRGKKIRNAILKTKLPEEIEDAVVSAYREMEKKYGEGVDVAVRSSATAEDLPGASFAGQQETFLNISGSKNVCEATKRCIASLFTDRAISYRVDKGFSHTDVALSVGIQKMVRSDIASSGVAFTIDPESGFENVVIINGIYGLGEFIVQGKVIPDEFIIFKPTLKEGKGGLIAKKLGKKNVKLIYSAFGGTKQVPVPKNEEKEFSLSDEEAVKLARWCVVIEEHFSKHHGRFQPMDIEWAKDGKTGELFIVQARPETVHSVEERDVYREYMLKKKEAVPVVKGISVGSKIGSGPVRIIKDVRGIHDFKKGEVLVTEITDPDWEPIMKIASAIVTDKGGRTSHAAIVSRELGIPCVVGTGNATKVLKMGEDVTVDCASGEIGAIYRGKIPFSVKTHELKALPETKTKIMVNVGSPDEAFHLGRLPAKGVGLGRLEFIIASYIRVHPNALIEYKELKKRAARTENPKERKTLNRIIEEIETHTEEYKDKSRFYVDELAEGIAKIAAAFWPHDVIIRFSDFKTNEYRKLIGGELYEPEEENPMLGWRGASRYYDPKFRDAFGLECKAMFRVREEMGLTNVIPMIPFCRTPDEGKKVLKIMAENGLSKEKDKSLKTYVMCEIPSNVLLADEFLKIFDGMSIGSNDLAQLTLGLDRDSGIVSKISNEKDESVKKLVSEIIKKCKREKKYIGICGQAPSDYPDFARFLIDEGIESISLNPDTVVKTIMSIAEKEK